MSKVSYQEQIFQAQFKPELWCPKITSGCNRFILTILEAIAVKSVLDKKVIAKQFKKDTGAIIAALTSMEEDEIEKLEAQARFIFFSWFYHNCIWVGLIPIYELWWNREKSADSDEIEVAGFKLKKDMVKFQSKLVKMHTVRIVFQIDPLSDRFSA